MGYPKSIGSPYCSPKYRCYTKKFIPRTTLGLFEDLYKSMQKEVILDTVKTVYNN